MSPDATPHDKRHDGRAEILGELHGEVMVFESMTVREISSSGAQIETRVQLQMNSLHTFRLTLGNQSVVVKGRVVHCQVAEVDQDALVYRAGIEFIEVPAPIAAVIADFMRSLKAARSGAH